MRFTPINDYAADQQAAAFRLWPRSIYPFEVLEAKERISSKGNDMIELRVKLFNNEGKERTIFDYLVDTENTAYKLRHFAKATGMLPQYDKGEMLAEHMVGKTGKCQLGIQKDKTGVYPDKNVISDYVPVVATDAPSATPTPATDPMEDDEIPF